MSKIPYIIQHDSPNLVIVPTDTVTSFEPSSENVKPVSALPAPSQNYSGSVFAKKYAKSNFNGVNNNVLIDVSKVQKPPTSWATNFMQSIGGSSTKFTRVYSAMPKSPSFCKNIQPENNTETTLAYTTQISYQTKTNTTTKSIMEEKKPNINLIKPKPKPAFQSTLTKEASQTNSNTKTYQSKMNTSTSQAKVRKEPSLPKNYKIPMHSKNKPIIPSVMDKESIMQNITKDTCQKSQPLVSSTKSNNNINELKQNKLTMRDTTSNKSAQPKANNDPNRSKHELIKAIQPETSREKTNETIQFKTKKIKVQPSNEHHTTKPKYDEQIIPPQLSKETVQPIRNKENSQPKYNKEIKQCKSTNETTLPRKYKDPSAPKSSKQITCLKTNEKIAQLMSTKETYKIKDKQEPSFSTKLKTKKDHTKVKSNQVSKISKHSESKHCPESKPKKHKDKTIAKEESNLLKDSLEKEDIVTKLKKKRTTEKESAETAEYTVSKGKKLKTADVNTTKKEKTRVVNEERLSKSISPIKSVVSKIKSDTSHNSEKRYHKETACTDFAYHCHNSQKSLHRDSDVDLRAKLKRKLPKNDHRKEDYKQDPSNKKTKFATVANGNPFVPEENLIISFNTKDGDEDVTMNKSPEKKMTREQSSGGKKRKKIKLEINIVFGQGDTTDDESIKSNDETKDEPSEHMDLSFLDDFNVDEIVESLNECKDYSRKTYNVPVADVTVQNNLSNETEKIETTVMRQNNVLLNTNEIKMETEDCKEMSPMENEIENQETALQSTDNKQRPCNRGDVHSTINSVISTIKEEVDINQKTKLPQNEKSQETNVCLPSSQVPKVNSSLKDTVHVHKRTDVSINIDKPQDDIISKLHVSDSNTKINNYKHSTTSLNNYAEEVKKTPTNTDMVLVPKIECEIIPKTENITETKEIKTLFTNTGTSVANSSSGNIMHRDHKDQDTNAVDSTNINTQAVKKNVTTSEMSSTVTPLSNAIEKTEGSAKVSASTEKITGTFTCINDESDIITIEDSDSENDTEIKNNQPVKDKNTKDIQLSKETPLDTSDDVIIIEPTTVEISESILILDTDYNIDKSDDIKCQLDVKNQNDTSENGTQKFTEQKEENELDTFDTPEKTTDEKFESEYNPIESQVSKETTSDIAKTGTQHGKDVKEDVSNNDKVANRSNPRTSGVISSKKPTETDTVGSEKCAPIKAIPNTKQQQANTQLKTNAPNKSSHPQQNCENKDKVTKNNDNVNRNLVYDHFIEKAERKLFFFMGRKCAIIDVIRIGKYSKIYLCKDSLKQEFALKAVKDECDGFRPRLKEQFQKEKMLMKLQNGVPENNLNCVCLIKGFVICGLWCLLMEFYPKNLQQAFAENRRSFHIDDVQALSRQLVSAVTILRNNNIIHSDIKPSHILINAAQTRIKLCGFDQSCYIEDSTLLPNTGTVNYRAPELIVGYPAGYGIDVWSTALVMYEMATNRKMFPGIYNNNILYQQLCTLGSIPMDMLVESKFRSRHFKGTAFSRIVGSNGERVIIDEITFNGKIDSILFQTYDAEWGHGRGQAGRRNDKAKLSAFLQLLVSMLVMHPRYRIAIEFVFANPFIYESFDNHC